MNYGRARELLGIEDTSGLTRKQLRRIYLRLLKAHPPEQDPDGFRELREAYELVREYCAEDDNASPATEAPAVVEFGDANEQLQVRVLGAEPPHPGPSEPGPPEPEPPEPRPQPAERVYAPLPPAAPLLPPPEPPIKLSALVPKIIELLEEGLVETAVELEQDWRVTGDADDFRHADPYTAARWVMVRELLSVAPELPVPVVNCLARGLRTGDWPTERANLQAFRLVNERAASRAHTVLAANALTVYRNVQNALYVTPIDTRVKIGQNIFGQPSSTPSGGGWRVLGVVAAIVVGIARFATIGHHTYSPSFDRPHLDYSALDYHPQLDPAAMDRLAKLTLDEPEVPSYPVDATDEQLWVKLSVWTLDWRKARWMSKEQFAISDLLWSAVLERDCLQTRRWLGKLDAAPAIDDPTKRYVVAEYMAVIHPAVDRVCPALPVKKKPVNKQ